MIRTSDRLIAPSRGTAGQAIVYARANGANRIEFVEGVLNEAERICKPDDMPDFCVVVARMADETGGGDGAIFVSPIFVARGNVGGLGVTDGADEGLVFETPEKAVRAMVAHMVLYATGDVARGGLKPADDPRYQAYRDAYGNKAVATTLQDLQGRWFTNPNGAIDSAARGNRIFPGIPDQEDTPTVPTTPPPTGTLNMTKGLIPLPPIVDHIVDVRQRCDAGWDPANRIGRGYDNLGPRTIDALFLHRSNGTWDSNINSFDSSCPAALTDLQIDHTNGRMMRFVRLNPPDAVTVTERLANGDVIDIPSGWASGSVTAPSPDVAALIAKHGGSANAVNQHAESCEVTGFMHDGGDDPVSDAAARTIAQWMASRAHDKGIRYDTFPMIPSENRSFVVGHRESRGGQEGDCPGNLLWSWIATTDAKLIAMARGIMERAQTGGTPTTGTTPAPQPNPFPPKRKPAPDHMTAQGHALKPNKPTRFTAKQGGHLKTGPGNDAPDASASPYKAGKHYTFSFRTAETIGGDVWLVSAGGSWAPAKNFEAA